ncbi:hypothetical protein QMX22_003608 [Escherichia coli]|nr:hypothetical protein [Escherichia coli]
MAIRRRRRMFILFAERKVGEQHGPAAQGVLAAVQTLREMNADNLRKVPADAPTAFIKPRWKPLVITPEGVRLENGKYPTLSLFFVQTDINCA